nr:DMT family transporter [Leptospira perolatii]
MSHLLLAITALLWGLAFHSAKIAMLNASPIMVASLRFGFASIFALILFKVEANGKPLSEIDRKNWFYLFWMSFFGIFIYNLFFFEGLMRTSAVSGSLIAGSNPGITALISVLLGLEVLSKKNWLGIFVSFLGVFVLITQGSLERLTTLNIGKGELLLICASISWAIYAIIGRKVMKEVPANLASGLSICIGTVLLFPLLIVRDGFDSLKTIPGLDETYFWLSIAYMGIFASVFAFRFWNIGVSSLGPARTSIYVNLVPIATAIIGIFAGESLSAQQYVGGGLILSGVYLTTKRATR